MYQIVKNKIFPLLIDKCIHNLCLLTYLFSLLFFHFHAADYTRFAGSPMDRKRRFGLFGQISAKFKV